MPHLRPLAAAVRRIPLALALIPALLSTSAWADDRSPADPALEALGIDSGDEAAEPEGNGIATRDLTRGIAVVRATLIAQEGDTPAGGGGAAIDSINQPVVDGTGAVGFGGNLVGDNYVWRDDDIVFLNSSVMPQTLTGIEGSLGIADDGSFAFSPSVDGADSLWSDNGLVISEDTQAPGFPMGTNSTFHSRPSMDTTGQAYWISGFNETGGTGTEGRILYTSPTASSGDITVVLRSDDVIEGLTIDRPSGVDFDYDFSNDGSHHIHVLLFDTGSTVDDGAVYVDGGIVARETDPLPVTRGVAAWDNFDQVAINNSGDYLFGGDTDEDTSMDEFIAYNGEIAIREGDTIGGVTLTTTATVRGLAINDVGHAAHAWNTSGSVEILFAACDASDLATSQVLLTVGDELELDGLVGSDAVVTDINTATVAGAGLAISNGGVVAIEVDIDDVGGGNEREAMITIDSGCLSLIFTDGFESGDTAAWSAIVP